MVRQARRPLSRWPSHRQWSHRCDGARRVGREILSLNDDSLWAGQPDRNENPDARAGLPLVEQASLGGRYQEADTLAKRLQGPFSHSFAPLGDLSIAMRHDDTASDYRRSLDLDQALASVGYTTGGATYRREILASRPDGILVVRVSADRKGAVPAN